ncbi:MAG: hypothetical protein JSS14_22325 [Proteobacteria bacterium]|nr:hypothetical protein [Pseudomonadota bacterium]
MSVFVPVALAASTVWAANGTAGAGAAPTAEQVRKEVRRAVEAHRAQERDDIRREEAEVGRRLTPAERAELREQIRYQWLLPSKSLGGTRAADDALGSVAPGPAASPDARRLAP